jgi:hypothetical protein
VNNWGRVGSSAIHQGIIDHADVVAAGPNRGEFAARSVITKK